jgi:hypothetical protein
MSLKRGTSQTGNKNTTQQQDAAPEAAAAPEQGYERRNQPRGRLGMSALGDRIHRPLKRGKMGEILAEFQKAGAEIFDEATGATRGMDFRILPLDASRHNLHYSAGLLVGITNIGGENVASVHTMILEGSAAAPRPNIVNMYGRQVEVVLTAMDAWDLVTWQKAQQVVTEQLGEGTRVINAGAMVVPSDVDIKDTDRVWQMIWAAHEAVLSTLESSYPEEAEHFNMGEFFDRSRDRMVAAFTYNGHDGESVTGLPVRSDIGLVLSTSERQAPTQDVSSFQHQTGKDLLEVNSFVDLVYAPPQQAPAYGQQPTTQVFVPRIVFTKVGALDAPFTPEVFFLGLATARLLGDNYAWASQFANFGKDEIHDIGAVGYRLKNPNDPSQPGQHIDTNSQTFGDQELFDLIQTTCHRDPVFSIDCEDVGPESWLTGALVESAHGNPQSTQYIVEALNNLTNGAFNKYWNGGQITVSENNRVHLGTYVDANGVQRDIREIDNLAVLNLIGHNDMNAVNLWESTFNDMSSPIELRLEQRLQMIRKITTNNLRLRGFAERLTFTGEFMAALVDSIVEAGLLVDQDGLQTMFGNNFTVGNTFISNYAVHGGNVGGMVNSGGPQGNFTFRRPMSRW